MIIRVLLIAAVLVMALIALRSTPSVRGLALRRMGLLAFTAAWIAAVLSPNSLSRIAQLVGVGRGTDLLLYALVVAVALGAIGVWKRFIALETRLAQLTRELALATAAQHAGAPHLQLVPDPEPGLLDTPLAT
jgi:hypothetical protein